MTIVGESGSGKSTLLNMIGALDTPTSGKVLIDGKDIFAMRAVGMDGHQITKMIAAEPFTYALSGCIAGCAVGLTVNKLLFDFLIAAHFGYAQWSLPVFPLFIILLFIFGAVIAAGLWPALPFAAVGAIDVKV